MRPIALQTALAVVSSSFASATSTFSPLRPPAIPLAVKSPYLSTWLLGDSNGNLAGNWPSFWQGSINGWVGFIKVDGTTYTWMGKPDDAPTLANQTSFEYTATKSIFTWDVGGKVALTCTFFSPVFPDDPMKQSLQFSYINLNVSSADNDRHDVQVYMDVSGELASSKLEEMIEWDTGNQGVLHYNSFQLQGQTPATESDDSPNWGTWYIATNASNDMSWRIGADIETRSQFVENGKLDNSKDTDFRAINDTWPVFALAHDLGNLSSDFPKALFVIGLVQDQVVNFQGRDDTPQPLDALWKRSFDNGTDSLSFFYNNYESALDESNSLDRQINDDSVQAGGQAYARMTTLATRQAFGAYQMAQGPGPDQDYAFLKEISSNGDCQTVDVIFPAFPMLLYLNPSLLRMALDPLYLNQESGHYPNTFSIHDLGVFPECTGHPDGKDEQMPLEESANMIIMTLAYAQRTNDTAYLTQHWDILDQWAKYLVDDSLVPAHQLSTDDFLGGLANQTNLAIKGIIGLEAMSRIARLTNHTAAAELYSDIAHSYYTGWTVLGINGDADPPHTTLAYGDDSSHGLLYNIFADRLLGLDLVGQDVYDMQSGFYPTVALEYGVPVDTRHDWVKSDWEVFCAAVAGDDTREMFLQRLDKWLGSGMTEVPMTDLFDARTGEMPQGAPVFRNRPVLGGLFALLALQGRGDRDQREVVLRQQPQERGLAEVRDVVESSGRRRVGEVSIVELVLFAGVLAWGGLPDADGLVLEAWEAVYTWLVAWL